MFLIPTVSLFNLCINELYNISRHQNPSSAFHPESFRFVTIGIFIQTGGERSNCEGSMIRPGKSFFIWAKTLSKYREY